MSLSINVISVRVSEKGRVIIPWEFLNLGTFASLTYSQLLNHLCEKHNFCKNSRLQFGTASSSFNLTEEIKGDPEVDVLHVHQTFGLRFFTLDIIQHENCDCEKPRKPPLSTPTAFDVLMESAKRQAGKDLPAEVPETSNYDKLQNSFLRYLTENDCHFSANTAAIGKTFLKRVSNLLWYIDGHLETFRCHAPVPEVLYKRFSGFNTPEAHKHRKRAKINLSSGKLEKISIELRECMQCMDMLNTNEWNDVKLEVFQFIAVIEEHAVYLNRQVEQVQKSQNKPRSAVEEKANVTMLKRNKGILFHALRKLDGQMKQVDPYIPISVRELLPAGLNRKQIYCYAQELKEKGLSSKIVYYIFNTGGPKQNIHFVWSIDENDDETQLINKCCMIIRKIEREIPMYETRITKREFKNTFGCVADPVALRGIFKELTGDRSAATSTSESEIDKRFKYAILSEDAGILVDLRHQSPDKTKDTFRPFFEMCELFLAEDVGVAVQDRRHGELLYLAKAVSIRDLHQQVKERMSQDAKIPSVKWLRYQFQPLNERANTSKYYKGHINIKMMVQKRQIRVNHTDSHYCAAAWHYMREMAIHHRELLTLVSMDDKHKIKVGEPSYPLAAVERGKQVIVGINQTMAVGDHDFSKCTLTPSVNLLIDIPPAIGSKGGFYRGQVHIGFKDSVLQPSSALRHATELTEILRSQGDIKPGLLIYTDGGPDHRNNYMSVKLSLIALFIMLDLDFLISLRTAPSNSWANPVERIMSIVNIGLQGIGVMRRKMSDNFEKTVANAGSVKEMREKVNTSALKDELADSLQFPVDLLKSQMLRLSLKDKAFQTFIPADKDSINTTWVHCLKVDKDLKQGCTTKNDVKNLKDLKDYLDHCCKESHYCFQIKKCGNAECEKCGPLRDERSKEVSMLPYPVLAGDGHYKPFNQVYGTETTENRPSAVSRPKSTRKKLTYSPSVQHAKNTEMMLQCEECDKWRLLFSKKKLTKHQKKQVQDIIADVSYTCGLTLDDLQMPHGIEVSVKDHDCSDHVEKLYYACGNEPICIYCVRYLEEVVEDAEFFPQCDDCSSPRIRKR